MPTLIHPSTKQRLETVITSTPQAVLLVGLTGSGKSYLASHISGQLLNTDSVEQHPYVKHVDAEQADGIDSVREIGRFLALKTTGKQDIRRIVIVHHAEKLGHEAQNALLKMLEEPPEDTMMILTADDTALLLPTILSRVQAIYISPISLSQARQELSLVDETQLLKAYHMSSGLAGLLAQLVRGESDHPLVGAIAQAKELLQASPYDRLSKVDTIAKQREELMQLLDALKRVSAAGFHSSLRGPGAKRFHTARQLVDDASRALQQNANTKLTLTKLFWEL